MDQQQQGDKAPTTQSLLDLAQTLIRRLQAQEETCIPDIEESILAHQYFDKIDLKLTPRCEEIKVIDDAAVKLWNSTTSSQSVSMSTQLRCLLQTFATSLLVICQNALGDNDSNLHRAFKYSLKAVESTLNENRVAWAKALMDRCIEYYGIMSKLPVSSNMNLSDSQIKLGREYILQQLHLAWRENQLDHATKWFEDINQHVENLDPATRHRLIILLVNIGQASSQKKRFAEARKWLLRANSLIISDNDPDSLKDESGPRLYLLQALVKFPVVELVADYRDLLKELFCKMDRASGNSMPYRLIQLEFYSKPEIFNSPDLTSADGARLQIDLALSRFARYAALSQATLDTIIHYAYKQFSVAQDQALTNVHGLLINRLKDEDNAEWTEKIIILIMHFQCVMDQPLDLEKKSILQLLDDYHNVFGGCISTLGAQTCIMGIAKCIKKSEKNSDQSTLLQWCQVGLHKIFGALDEENKARLQRKLMQYWITKGKHLKVKQAYENMDLLKRESSESLYLLFKSTIRHGTVSSAQQILKKLIELPNIDKEVIYACVSEAQNNKKPVESILWVMQTILSAEGKAFGTPAMYRCALEHARAGKVGNTKSVLGEQIQIKTTCELFEKAAQDMIQSTGEAAELWDAHELQWFSVISWNLGLEHMNNWSASEISLLAQATTKFTERLIEQSPPSSLLNKQHLLAVFLDCAFNLDCAKVSREQQAQDERFQAVLAKSNNFHRRYDSVIESLSDIDAVEIHKKASGVTAFAFEAALRMGKWDNAKDLLQSTNRDGGKHLDFEGQAVLGDLVLSIDAPLEETTSLLELIMENCWSLTGDVQKLSCWIRCIFLITVEPHPGKADCILESVCSLAQKHSNYPDEELKWLAGHTYNRAIEHYESNHYDLWTNYTNLALRLSQCMNDQSLYTSLATTVYEINSDLK